MCKPITTIIAYSQKCIFGHTRQSKARQDAAKRCITSVRQDKEGVPGFEKYSSDSEVIKTHMEIWPWQIILPYLHMRFSDFLHDEVMFYSSSHGQQGDMLYSQIEGVIDCYEYQHTRGCYNLEYIPPKRTMHPNIVKSRSHMTFIFVT